MASDCTKDTEPGGWRCITNAHDDSEVNSRGHGDKSQEEHEDGKVQEHVQRFDHALKAPRRSLLGQVRPNSRTPVLTEPCLSEKHVSAAPRLRSRQRPDATLDSRTNTRASLWMEMPASEEESGVMRGRICWHWPGVGRSGRGRTQRRLGSSFESPGKTLKKGTLRLWPIKDRSCVSW